MGCCEIIFTSFQENITLEGTKSLQTSHIIYMYLTFMYCFADVSHQYQFPDFSSTKSWSGDGSFILHTARCGTTPFETKNEMIFFRHF